MKFLKLTFLFFCVAGLLACRKTNSDPDIKQYDEDQIKAYIAANGLSSMKRDAGDTTGIYYQILSQGTGARIDYPDQISMVFSVSTLDGKFNYKDTIFNHAYTFAGHIPSTPPLSKGVMLAVVNMLKNKGGRMRVLVPSRLGFGTNGYGFGSIEANNRIGGNQSLDYYINVVDDQAKYDQLAISNYMTANALTGYTAVTVPSGGKNYTMYYKVTQAGSGGAAIGPGSVVEIQYTSLLLNGAITSDSYNTTTGSGISVDLGSDTRAGIVTGLQYAKVGDKLSLILPSQLVYGKTAAATDIPSNSCLRYEINVISVQ